MFLFFELQTKLVQYLLRSQIRRIAQAFLVAADAHETQVRSSGEPYITHPVAVACLLADMHMDADTIIAALLHDVLEDTHITPLELRKDFGPQVLGLVEGMSKLMKMEFDSKAEAQAENFRKMILAMAKDIRVILIKLTDRLHNMRTLSSLRPEKRRRIATETLEVYSPIAHRLGMNAIKNELEDLAFDALYPMRHRVLSKAVESLRGNRSKLMEKIQKIFTEHLVEKGVPPENIYGREKRLFSIYRKMARHHAPFSEVMDVYGFRILGKDEADCYRILGAVHSIFKPVPGKFKDYIAIPKVNGYQSLHTTLFGPHGVPVEVQIRTFSMEAVADRGIAAHWLYKYEGYVNPTEVKTKEWLTRLLEMQKGSGTPFDFMEDVKDDLFPDAVYVFTPRGEIMAFPRGVTVLDFAYALHSNLGDHCEGALVNRRYMPGNQEIFNGQVVEILTNPSVQPEPSWLTFVVTGKAKAGIREALKAREQHEAILLGQELIKKSLQEFGVRCEGDGPPVIPSAVLESFQMDSEDTLFQKIGRGDIPAGLIVQRLLQGKKNVKSLSMRDAPVIISNASGFNMKFSTCCHPIPGDDIQGILQKGQGIEVHLDTCPDLKKAKQQLSDSQLVNLAWAKQVSGNFLVKLKIEILNEVGAFSLVAKEIADAGVNIEEVIGVSGGRATGRLTLTVTVHHRVHLSKVMKRLHQLKKIVRLYRC